MQNLMETPGLYDWAVFVCGVSFNAGFGELVRRIFKPLQN